MPGAQIGKTSEDVYRDWTVTLDLTRNKTKIYGIFFL